MDKIKGWKAEYKIDKALNIMRENIIMEKEAQQVNTALRQAKTLIMTLREENKFLEKECKRESDDYETYYNKWLDADCELRKLKKQNKEMLKQHQDYFDENEKLKQENDKLKKENEKYIKQLNLVVAGLIKISHCSNEVEIRKECDMCLYTMERIK